MRSAEIECMVDCLVVFSEIEAFIDTLDRCHTSGTYAVAGASAVRYCMGRPIRARE